MDSKVNEQLKLAKILRTGILNRINQDSSILQQLKEYSAKYHIKETDSDTEKVFKSFVINGNNHELIKKYGFIGSSISDILFFRQVEDITLTLLAKSIYAVSGSPYKDFLIWQIEVILKDGKINIKDEYRKWLTSIGRDENTINVYISENKFDF